jgi:outer membrane lipoprotein-sorting protein
MIRRASAILFAMLAAVAEVMADPTLTAQLAKIDVAAATIKDMSAHFQQRKFTSLLVKPLVSTGRVRSCGSVVRWDTQQPQPAVLYADKLELRLYYPEQKLEEVYPLDQRLGDLIASPLPRLAAIRDHFNIARAAPGDLADGLEQTTSAEILTLRLTPIDHALAQHVQAVIVVLDVKTGLSMAVRTIDPDGDRTDMMFSGVRLNTGLDPSALQLNVPADTMISHPLENTGPATNPSP